MNEHPEKGKVGKSPMVQRLRSLAHRLAHRLLRKGESRGEIKKGVSEAADDKYLIETVGVTQKGIEARSNDASARELDAEVAENLRLLDEISELEGLTVDLAHKVFEQSTVDGEMSAPLVSEFDELFSRHVTHSRRLAYFEPALYSGARNKPEGSESLYDYEKLQKANAILVKLVYGIMRNYDPTNLSHYKIPSTFVELNAVSMENGGWINDGSDVIMSKGVLGCISLDGNELVLHDDFEQEIANLVQEYTRMKSRYPDAILFALNLYISLSGEYKDLDKQKIMDTVIKVLSGFNRAVNSMFAGNYVENYNKGNVVLDEHDLSIINCARDTMIDKANKLEKYKNIFIASLRSGKIPNLNAVLSVLNKEGVDLNQVITIYAQAYDIVVKELFQSDKEKLLEIFYRIDSIKKFDVSKIKDHTLNFPSFGSILRLANRYEDGQKMQPFNADLYQAVREYVVSYRDSMGAFPDLVNVCKWLGCLVDADGELFENVPSKVAIVIINMMVTEIYENQDISE